MRKSIWLLTASLAVLSTPAFAQDTAEQPSTPAEAPVEAASVDSAGQAAEADDGDAAIVVTATRRSEALSDIPLAVSAITADTIKNSGAVDLRGLNQVSPSLLVSSTSSEAGAGGARIRGIGTVGDNAGLESSVAVFIDGVYRSRIGTGLTELGPVDRVEVLRGPQGTLFGRNASSGLIHVITAKPKFTTEAYGEATIGNYNLRRIDLGVTGAITDSLAARIDGVYLTRDGFIKDVISGDRVNDRNRWLLRGQILYQPTDAFSIRIIGDYSKRNEDCCAAVYLPGRDYTATGNNTGLTQPSTILAIERGLGAIINDDPYDRETSITPGRSYNSDVVDYGVSAEINYDFGGAELTSITAYRFNDFEQGSDTDFNNLDILFRDGSGGSGNRFKTFTQELRLQGKAFGDRLDWLVGGFAMSENLRVKSNLSYGADYERYANCLAANNFANLTGQPALRNTASPTCFSVPVATAIRSALEAQFIAAAGNPTLQAALASQIGVISAFARLPADAFVPANFGGPPFTNSGFTNVSLANGAGLRTFNGVATDDRFEQKDTNWSLFTHNIFSLTERLKLTVGVRYTRDKKKLEAQLIDNNTLCSFFSLAVASLQTVPCVIPSAPGGNFSDTDTKKENKWTGTIALSWKPIDEILLYGSVSRGYKAGGFNLDRAALPRSGGNGAILANATLRSLQFEPEINTAYELGLKYNGNRIDANFALFRQDFDDFQLNTFNGLNFEVATINSCGDDLNGTDTDSSSFTGACNGKLKSGVRSQGAELEIFTRPFRDARFNFGLTYVQTKYRTDLVGANGIPTSNQLFQLPGRNLSNAPELSVTGSFSWTPPIGNSGLRGLLYIDGRHVSSFNTGSDLDIEKTQESFSVVNGRIGLSGGDGMWAIEFWAQNLLNRNYKQVAFDMPLQGSCTERGAQAGFCTALLPGSGFPNRSTQLFGAFLGEPRTFGMTLKAKFRAARPVVEEPPVVEAPPPPPPPAPTQTCSDGSVILASDACPPPPPPPPPPVEPERG